MESYDFEKYEVEVKSELSKSVEVYYSIDPIVFMHSALLGLSVFFAYFIGVWEYTPNNVFSVKISPDQQYSLYSKNDSFEIKRLGDDTSILKTEEPGFNAAFSPDSTKVAWVDYDETHIHDLNSGNSWKVPDADRISFNLSGNSLATLGAGDRFSNKAQIWDIKTQSVIWAFTPFSNPFSHEPGEATNNTLLSYSPDGKFLVLGSSQYNYMEHLLSIWNVEKRERVVEFKGDKALGSIAFSPDSELFVMGFGGGGTGFVSLFKTKTGEKVADLPNFTEITRNEAWSPNGHMIAFSYWDSIEVWNVKPLSKAFDLNFADNIEIKNLQFSTDSDELLVTNKNGDIKALRIETKEISEILYKQPKKSMDERWYIIYPSFVVLLIVWFLMRRYVQKEIVVNGLRQISLFKGIVGLLIFYEVVNFLSLSGTGAFMLGLHFFVLITCLIYCLSKWLLRIPLSIKVGLTSMIILSIGFVIHFYLLTAMWASV